jgi:DNA-binding LacI/PurR family transcriptional regulator
MIAKPRKKLTLKDVANVLSIAPSTVSKALRDSSDISEEMKEKVKYKAEELGYRPNLLARSLINNKSRILGILIPDLRISFFSEAVRGMYEEANKKGYQTILLVHDENKDIERDKLEFLSDIHADGILLNAVDQKSNFDLYNQLAEEGTKIVCWDRRLEGLGFHSVTIDDKKASFELTSKMIKQGRRHILFFGPNTRIPVVKDRLEGYKLALKKNGIAFNPKLVVHTFFRDYSKSYRKMLSIINSKIKIDGVISIGGIIAYGAAKAILASNLKIPKDIMLGEFGDNDVVARLGVPFYAVYQNPYMIGKSSVDLLIKLIEHKGMHDNFNDIIIEFKILKR